MHDLKTTHLTLPRPRQIRIARLRAWTRFPAGECMKARVLKGAVVGVTLGAALGVGGYTFLYARGASYFTNNPQACANCHVMQPYYDGWIKSSHRAVAVCNDCHAPHDNVVHKYWVKGDNGFWHSLKFTTGKFPDNIQMREVNRRVTENACLHC